MGSTKIAIAITVAILTAAFSISTAANSFCETAKDAAFCSDLTGGATTWSEAMTNALKAALEKAKAGKPISDSVEAALPADMLEKTKKSLVQSCKEDYEAVVYNLNRCLGFVGSDPESSMNIFLSAVSLSDCTDGLKDFNVSLPAVEEYGGQILNVSSALLTVASKKTVS